MRRSVLVVEDDQDVRDALSESLEDAGYDVRSAANGAIALAALHAAAELPRLILLDLMMPVMDGAHLLEELRTNARFAAVPIVVLTADGNASSRAVELGAELGLRKPVKLGELLAAVSKYCGAP